MVKKFSCDFCQTEVPLDAVICPTCGRSFSAIKCPKCNYKGSSAEFNNGCPKCRFKSPHGKNKTSTNLPFWITIIVCGGLFFSLLLLFLKIFF
ncbi:MAG: double zinc ribbon domain-containing protein [Treponemataceae bacterium]